MNLNLRPSRPFTISPNAESIYYADLFRIKDKVWMITGSGKSRAARIASNNITENDIARDFVAITRDKNVLYGNYDAVYHYGTESSYTEKLCGTKYKIDFIAHCLNDIQSESFYTHKSLEIEKINNQSLASLIIDYPYPIVAMFLPEGFNIEQYHWLTNSQRRFDRFLELTNDICQVQFVVIPWMRSIEEKASLYLSY